MPALRKDVDPQVRAEVVRLARSKKEDGNYVYTYAEIGAQIDGQGLTKDEVSAICLAAGVRRKNRTMGQLKSEDSILQEIQRLNNQLHAVRQRVRVVWAATGEKLIIENCKGKNDSEILLELREFLSHHRLLVKANGSH